VNPTDKKFRLAGLAETLFVCVLAFAVVYSTPFLLPRVNPLGMFDGPSYMWRLNPYLAPPYLAAGVLGMVVAPLIWEKVARRANLKRIGFTIPRPLFRELVIAAGLSLAFVAYCHLVLSRRIELPYLPAGTVMSWCSRWLLVAFAEEFFFRGVLQRRLCDLCGGCRGLVLASAVFAFAGQRSRSLVIPIAMHGGFNVFFAA